MTTITIPAKYLATAYHLKLMSRKRAWEVWDARQRYIGSGITPPPCGAIACELGILTPEQAEEVEQRREELAEESVRLEDPVARPPKHRPWKFLGVRVDRGAGVILFLGLGLASAFGDWNAVAMVGGIGGSLWLCFTLVFPGLREEYFAVHRLAHWLLIAMLLTALPYSVFMANEIRLCALDSATCAGSVTGLWKRFAWSASIVGIGGLWLYVMSAWRHREIWYLEARTDLMRCLLHKAYHTDCYTTNDQESDRYAPARDLLETAAGALRLNPWLALMKRIMFWRSSVGAPSVWYLEPCATPEEGFEVKAWAAPGAPIEVHDSFKEIAEKFRPAAFDREWLDQAVKDHTSEEGIDVAGFRSNKGRFRHLSICGFVYSNCQGIPSGDAQLCMAFNDQHVEALSQEPPPAVLRWLDYQVFSAYPVFNKGRATDAALGVLLAFKNVPNQMTPEDRNMLVMTSRLLGVVLGRDGEPNVRT